MELVKVLIIGIVIALLSVILKQVKPEYSLICVLVGSIVLLIYIVNSISNVFDFFMTVVSKTGIDDNMFKILLKIIGIGYLIEFSAGVCVDSGNSSIADKIVLAGKLLIFGVSLPLISNLFNMILDLINLWN